MSKTENDILDSVPLDNDGDPTYTLKEVKQAMNEFASQELAAYKESILKLIDIQISVGIENAAPNNEIELLRKTKTLINQTV